MKENEAKRNPYPLKIEGQGSWSAEDTFLLSSVVCIPHMEKGSHIINIASQASFQPLPYQNIYSSTKAFVRNYTRALNVELKDKGVTATAVYWVL